MKNFIKRFVQKTTQDTNVCRHLKFSISFTLQFLYFLLVTFLIFFIHRVPLTFISFLLFFLFIIFCLYFSFLVFAFFIIFMKFIFFFLSLFLNSFLHILLNCCFCIHLIVSICKSISLPPRLRFSNLVGLSSNFLLISSSARFCFQFIFFRSIRLFCMLLFSFFVVQCHFYSCFDSHTLFDRPTGLMFFLRLDFCFFFSFLFPSLSISKLFN